MAEPAMPWWPATKTVFPWRSNKRGAIKVQAQRNEKEYAGIERGFRFQCPDPDVNDTEAMGRFDGIISGILRAGWSILENGLISSCASEFPTRFNARHVE